MQFLTDTTTAARCIYHCYPVLGTIDWAGNARLATKAILICGAIYLPILLLSYLGSIYHESISSYTRFITRLSFSLLGTRPEKYPSGRPRGTICCGPSPRPDNSNRRTIFGTDVVFIYAWPSRGGVIIHDHAEAIDFEFLDLDPLDPPRDRCVDQEDEDNFCQKLLGLGAIWYDSESRFSFLSQLKYEEESGSSWIPAHCKIEDGKQMEPTSREKAFVYVGWHSTGGLWVKEWTTNLYIAEGPDEDYLPHEMTRLKLCRTMDERCEVLKRFEARWYAKLRDYERERTGFLNAWSWKETGEVGSLEQRIRRAPKGGTGVVKEKQDV